MQAKPFKIGSINVGLKAPMFLIAGPCVIETKQICLDIAKRLADISTRTGVGVIYKASFDKANRSSVSSFRGPGLKKGLEILAAVRAKVKLPIMTDVHLPEQAETVAKVVDALQIPAFLCRQTDLVVAAARTGKVINVKKGQFMAPWDMKNVVDKVLSAGNPNIILTERGASFGYNNLVSDMRSFPIMRGFGYPVIFDATHSVQIPGGQGTSSGGRREFVECLARAAVATGIDGIFLEVHEDPEKALCDGPNSVKLEDLPAILKKLKAIDAIVK